MSKSKSVAVAVASVAPVISIAGVAYRPGSSKVAIPYLELRETSADGSEKKVEFRGSYLRAVYIDWILDHPGEVCDAIDEATIAAGRLNAPATVAAPVAVAAPAVAADMSALQAQMLAMQQMVAQFGAMVAAGGAPGSPAVAVAAPVAPVAPAVAAPLSAAAAKIRARSGK